MNQTERKNWLRQALAQVRAFARRPAPARPAETPPALGVALGGGFARGLAHIGVLKVLQEEKIPVACLAGTSIGSIIAGAYAAGSPLGEIAEVARAVRWKDFGQWTLNRMGLASNERLEAFVVRNFRALRFEDLRIPLAVVATDLQRGRPVVFTRGELARAVRASCAYPGLFLPVAYDGGWLVDGGLVSEVPVQAARSLGAEKVLAVTLQNIQADMELRTMLDVLARSFSIAQQTAEPLWRADADLVVEPVVSQFRWDEFNRCAELMAAGEQAMRARLPRLRELLQPASPRAGAAAR